MKILQKVRDCIFKKDESFYQSLHIQLLPYFISALIYIFDKRPFHLTSQNLLQEYVKIVLDVVEEIDRILRAFLEILMSFRILILFE